MCLAGLYPLRYWLNFHSGKRLWWPWRGLTMLVAGHAGGWMTQRGLEGALLLSCSGNGNFTSQKEHLPPWSLSIEWKQLWDWWDCLVGAGEHNPTPSFSLLLHPAKLWSHKGTHAACLKLRPLSSPSSRYPAGLAYPLTTLAALFPTPHRWGWGLGVGGVGRQPSILLKLPGCGSADTISILPGLRTWGLGEGGSPVFSLSTYYLIHQPSCINNKSVTTFQSPPSTRSGVMKTKSKAWNWFTTIAIPYHNLMSIIPIWIGGTGSKSLSNLGEVTISECQNQESSTWLLSLKKKRKQKWKNNNKKTYFR